MQKPTATVIRISVFLGLLVAECFGLNHFYGRQDFSRFLIWSLSLFLLTLPFFWLDRLRQRGATWATLWSGTVAGCIAVEFNLHAFGHLEHGEYRHAVALIWMALSILVLYFVGLLWPKRKDTIGLAILISLYAASAVFMWRSNSWMVTKILLPIPALAYVCLLATKLFKKKKTDLLRPPPTSHQTSGNGGLS